MALVKGSSLEGRLWGVEWFLIVWLLEATAGEVVALVNGRRLDGRLPPAFGGSRLSISG